MRGKEANTNSLVWFSQLAVGRCPCRVNKFRTYRAGQTLKIHSERSQFWVRLETTVIFLTWIHLFFSSHLHSYGHYAEGTGSVLKMANIDVRCALRPSNLETHTFLFVLWCFQSWWYHLLWNISHRISFIPSSIYVYVCFYSLFCSFFVCLAFFRLDSRLLRQVIGGSQWGWENHFKV